MDKLLNISGYWLPHLKNEWVFTLTYALTLVGNGSIICAVKLDQHLHTPMYIVLAHFSFLETCYVNTTVLNMLANVLCETKTISFTACFLQFHFFFSTDVTEPFFLSLMAFDRYLAIWQPLHYFIIITGHFCIKLVLVCWVTSFLSFPICIYFMSQLPFCGSNVIDDFICDPGPLISLICIHAPGIELSFSIIFSLVIFLTFPFILGSYNLVFRAVLPVPLSVGRKKALSTCGSHLTVVSLFFGTVLVMYITPTSEHITTTQTIITLFYSVFTLSSLVLNNSLIGCNYFPAS
ncbi:olfactory receptor 11H6-like [Antechinus flavipes]|uniref:olfactory receptor 11H6-like n=1 Tax=Antechinus flavipes TaxID=38775 RepID=UPI00223634A4|nr:olfactory receptor 11H6-like [Antechinus flavipes]